MSGPVVGLSAVESRLLVTAREYQDAIRRYDAAVGSKVPGVSMATSTALDRARKAFDAAVSAVRMSA